jgi:hypothetical protein
MICHSEWLVIPSAASAKRLRSRGIAVVRIEGGVILSRQFVILSDAKDLVCSSGGHSCHTRPYARSFA